MSEEEIDRANGIDAGSWTGDLKASIWYQRLFAAAVLLLLVVLFIVGQFS